MGVDPGVNPHNVLTLTFDLPDKKYSDQQQVEFYNQLLARLRSLPGVVSASGVTPMPFSGGNAVITFQIDGHPVPRAEAPSADIKVSTPGYFHTFGIPVINGRDFNEHDERTAPGVMIVNEAFARRFFPEENALGKRITPGASNGGNPAPREIIGVVGNVKARGLNSEAVPEYYIPFAQLNFGSMAVCLRTGVEPHSITSAVRSVVASMDADLPLYDIKTVDEYLAASLATPRFNAVLLEVFAVLALLLTALGLYGVVAYTVAQRTHEIGVRMTLGATRASVTQMVLTAGFKLTAIGIGIGVVGSLVAARFLTAFTSLLFGVKPTDAMTFVAVVGILAAVSLLACYIPARRAAKVDPMVALRYE